MLSYRDKFISAIGEAEALLMVAKLHYDNGEADQVIQDDLTKAKQSITKAGKISKETV